MFFLVTAHGGEKHAVTLSISEHGEPEQYCTCAFTVTCSHILAFMLSMGFFSRESKIPANWNDNETKCEEMWRIWNLKQKVTIDPAKQRRKRLLQMDLIINLRLIVCFVLRLIINFKYTHAAYYILRVLECLFLRKKNISRWCMPYAEEAEMDKMKRYNASFNRKSIIRSPQI